MNTFSPTEAIKFGWKSFTANPGFLLGLIVIVYVIQFAVGIVVGLVPSDSSSGAALTFLLSLVSNAISILISLGMINALLKFVNTGKGNFSDIFSELTNFSLLINYFIGSILVGLIVIGGLFLLIVPGIYFAIRLSQFPYFIVDKKIGALEAIKASWNATKGNVWNLIGFGLLSFGVMILGFIALIVGVLAAIPVVSVASVYVYKMLSQQQVSAAPAATVAQPETPPTTPTAT